MANFYKAEKKTLNPKLLRESFAVVCLQQWNKQLILRNCREQSPDTLDSDENGIINELELKNGGVQ